MGSFLKVVLTNIDVLVGPMVSLAYPLYASIRAIETKSHVDDHQWLTYWILYSMITLFELTFGIILEWIPIWSYGKLIATCWLVLPHFKGAAYVYEHYVRPFYVNSHTINSRNISTKNDNPDEPNDILTVAEKYIEEYGSVELRRIGDKESKSRSGRYNW